MSVTAENNPLVELKGVEKEFSKQGDSKKVLSGIDFDIRKGEVVSILGQSGCGKSTLLNLIGGFDSPTGGELFFDGKQVTKPSRRAIMLFQYYALLPWRTVLKNVELALEPEGLSKEESRERAIRYIKLVGLEKSMDQFPSELSGGMQQRVAIARALSIRPELILMDEPFAALDTFNRYYLQDELLRIQQQEGTNIILVTHDIDEAVYLSDRVFIMDANPGTVRKKITVKLPKPRDRAHSDFQYYRKWILDEFNFSYTQDQLDFNI
ncbi:ABC transporter ATP-binding protein [Salipaludibacillus aurantiacus]|uniref:NitT/TauT family transport system ATP-binding protein n=1 Tax=Salipaludibacillus aurantiacus TaxID=1601833 RepID=A0A1H9V1A2_9BACI|nr:ABC transporter ATP-binding protein [Salipaludibacillus aurantiacus]SES15043.1 NitT/TauT family transport system ATP-binding protein [Salipaludibacillus aurantiacus]